MTRTNGNLCGFYVFVESEELKAKQGQKARKCTHTNTHTQPTSQCLLFDQSNKANYKLRERERKKEEEKAAEWKKRCLIFMFKNKREKKATYQ